MLEIKDLHVQFHTSDHEAVRGIDLTVFHIRLLLWNNTYG